MIFSALRREQNARAVRNAYFPHDNISTLYDTRCNYNIIIDRCGLDSANANRNRRSIRVSSSYRINNIRRYIIKTVF